MSLRNKAFSVVSVTFLFFIVLLVLFSQFILYKNYDTAEQASILRENARVQVEFAKQFNTLEVFLREYADWDTTVDYLTGQYPEYPEVELSPLIQRNIAVDVAIFTDLDRTIVFGQALTSLSGDARDLTVAETEITQQHRLFQIGEPNTVTQGILQIGDQIALVVAKPILNSLAATPAAGYLIYIKYLSNELVAQMGQDIALDLKIFPLPFALPVYVSNAQEQMTPDQPIYVNLSDNIQAYALMNDLNGNPIIITQITMERIILQQGRNTVTLFIGVSAASALVLLLLLTAWLERSILSPITRLNAQLDQIRQANSQTRVSLKGNDELAMVSQHINDMLARVENSVQVQSASDVLVGTANQRLERVTELLRLTLNQVEDIARRNPDAIELKDYVQFAKQQFNQLE